MDDEDGLVACPFCASTGTMPTRDTPDGPTYEDACPCCGGEGWLSAGDLDDWLDSIGAWREPRAG